ncbi:MAG: lysylphosphatidylglycerol synthase domain-containing protein, partial [Rhodospirillales bacterium]|nr:lysylphosphatidylglycerol synthase domain-containing protein [Rhodospirillales bacterium]
MKKAISLIVSAIIIAFIYAAIDLFALLAAFQRTDLFLLITAVAMVVPIVGLTALRLKWLIPGEKRMGFGDAVRAILGGAVLNILLPAKMGDIAKFALMRREGALSGSLAFSTVIFEKTTDMLALLVWCVFGLSLYAGSNELTMVLAMLIAIGIVFGLTLLASESAADLFFGGVERILPATLQTKFGRLIDAWAVMRRHFWQDRHFAMAIFL